MLKNGFQRCNIYPFNPDAIDTKQLMPSGDKETSIVSNTDNNVSSSRESSASSLAVLNTLHEEESSSEDSEYSDSTQFFVCKQENALWNYGRKKNVWIVCDKCEMWFYNVCKNATDENIKAESYVYKACIEIWIELVNLLISGGNKSSYIRKETHS